MRGFSRTALRTLLSVSAVLALASFLFFDPARGGFAWAERCDPDPYVGTFTGEAISIDISSEAPSAAPQRYGGIIRMKGQRLPFVAGVVDGRLEGSFASDGNTFPFTARLDGNGAMALFSGGATYRLTRAAAAQANPPLTGASTLPANLRIVNKTNAGQVLAGDRPGARSARQAIHDTASDLAACFGKPAELGAGMLDAQDTSGGAEFTASYGGRAVAGAILAHVGPQGARVVAVFYRTDAGPQAAAQLLASADANGPGAATGEVQLATTPLPDGSGTIDLPPGWKIMGSNNGTVQVNGPANEHISLNAAMAFMTPEYKARLDQLERTSGARSPLFDGLAAPYSPDPVQAVQNVVPALSALSDQHGDPSMRVAKILGATPAPGMAGSDPNTGKAALVDWICELTARGGATKRLRTLSEVQALATAPGRWILCLTEVAAPEAAFEQELPTLLRICQSLRVNVALVEARNRASWAVCQAMVRTAQGRMNQLAHQVQEWTEVMSDCGLMLDTATGELKPYRPSQTSVNQQNAGAGYQRFKKF